MSPFPRQAIKMGCLEEGMSHESHGVETLIVRENDQNIWALLVRLDPHA